MVHLILLNIEFNNQTTIFIKIRLLTFDLITMRPWHCFLFRLIWTLEFTNCLYLFCVIPSNIFMTQTNLSKDAVTVLQFITLCFNFPGEYQTIYHLVWLSLTFNTIQFYSQNENIDFLALHCNWEKRNSKRIHNFRYNENKYTFFYVFNNIKMFIA